MPNLYVTEPGARIEKEAGQLLVTFQGEVRFAAPATRIDQVVLVGPVGVTTPALHFLLQEGIGLVLLTTHGAFRGRLTGRPAKNIALRRAQYRRAEDAAFCLGLSKAIVDGKLRNMRTLMMRWDDTGPDPAVDRALAQIDRLRGRAALAVGESELRGVEGVATRGYFGQFRKRIDESWRFERRGRRPPPDPVNCLLSVCYTLLQESCFAALEAAGLDPLCGFFHEERHGRPSLAIDLMEEFRPIIADSVVLMLLNKHMVDQEDFEPGPKGGVYLTRSGWQTVVRQYDKRLRILVKPEGMARQISYQKVLELQARGMARVIDGTAERYEPFLAK